MVNSITENGSTLRPYPELSDQESVVSVLYNINLALAKIKAFILKPFDELSKIFYYCPADKLSDKRLTVAPILVKTENETFDQKCAYIIRDSKIYFRPFAAEHSDVWKEIPFPKIPTKISADGDNLIVVADDQHIYYAKTNEIEFHVTDCGWEASHFQLDWKKEWFNMDAVASVVNFFKPAKLYAMEGARSIAMSHKGTDALYHTDRAGKRHPDPFVGVTTLYMLSPSGTRIFFADPWLPNKFHNEITGPEEGRFVAESMDASASTLFVFQRAQDASGNEIHKMYTRYADFDTIGSNPFLPITYDPKNKTPLVRLFPGEDWIEQPCIPLEGNAHLTKRIAMIQTGRGQANRQMRVEGTNRHGHTGYYYKNIYDRTWAFQRTNHAISREAFLPQVEHGRGLLQGPQVSHDYIGWIETKNGTFNATLKKFSFQGHNERGLHTQVELELPSGEKISSPLYARRGIRHLFDMGMHHPYWTLIAPDLRDIAKPKETSIFSRIWERVSPSSSKLYAQDVDVGVHQHQIVIQGKGFKARFPIDTQVPIPPKLPPCIVRCLIRGTLPFLNGVKYILKLARRVLDRIANNFKTTKAQEHFFDSLQLEDVEDTKKVMRRMHATNPTLAPQIVMDFLLRPSIAPHLKEMMHGANILLQGNTEDLYKSLTKLEGAKERTSSHPHQNGTSYGLEIPLFGEMLFWKDESGQLRLQFEAHSLRNIFKVYYHLVDYLHYKLEGEQQGLYGSSKHTDENPLILQI